MTDKGNPVTNQTILLNQLKSTGELEKFKKKYMPNPETYNSFMSKKLPIFDNEVREGMMPFKFIEDNEETLVIFEFMPLPSYLMEEMDLPMPQVRAISPGGENSINPTFKELQSWVRTFYEEFDKCNLIDEKMLHVENRSEEFFETVYPELYKQYKEDGTFKVIDYMPLLKEIGEIQKIEEDDSSIHLIIKKAKELVI